MDTAQKTKIETGVLTCLDECRAVDQPYTKVTAFIEGLKADPNWSADEIVELQTQVIRALLFRLDRSAWPVGVMNPTPASKRQTWLGLTILSVVLLIAVVVIVLTIFIGVNVVLNNQFRGLRQQRQDSMKALQQPPRALRPTPAPPESTPPPEPDAPPPR